MITILAQRTWRMSACVRSKRAQEQHSNYASSVRAGPECLDQRCSEGTFMITSRKAKKRLAGKGLVKKSARLSAVATSGTEICILSTASRMIL